MVAAAFAVFPRILLIPPLRHASWGGDMPVLLPLVPLHSVPPVFQSHPLPPDLCNASQITIDFMHENFSFLLPIPLVFSLNAETALTYFAYSLSNSPSKFPNLITATFSWLCRLRNPHGDKAGDTSFGSSSLGLPGAGALQEMSLAKDTSSFPEGMWLYPWQGSGCCPKREKWESNLMKNLISVLLGSSEIFSLICSCFQNLSPLCTLSQLCHVLSTCVFMDFTLPTLIFFFREKTQPTPTRFSYSAISDYQN